MKKQLQILLCILMAVIIVFFQPLSIYAASREDSYGPTIQIDPNKYKDFLDGVGKIDFSGETKGGDQYNSKLVQGPINNYFKEYKLEPMNPKDVAKIKEENKRVIADKYKVPDTYDKGKEVGGSILQTGFTVNLINGFDSFVQATGKNVDITNGLIKSGASDIRRAFFNADGTFQAGKSYKDYENAITNLRNQGLKESKQAGKINAKGAVVGGVSMALNAYTLYNDAKDLKQGNMKNRSTTGLALEYVGLIADGTLAAVGIIATGAAVAGSTAFAVPAAVGLTVGLAAGVVHTDTFADAFDSMGRKLDEMGMESYIDIAVDSWMLEGTYTRNFSDNIDFILEEIGSLFGMQTSVPRNVSCYKPNIYIYTQEETQVNVEFAYPDLLTTTIPEYKNNWNVIAKGDGRLVDTLGNNEEYNYLFYESIAMPHFFQKDTGWLIVAGTREQQYRDILTDYGFNETEIADFIEYWTEKLPQGVDYIMYPQNTETVNYVMPVNVTPEPDSMERIWFTFEEYNGQRCGIPTITPIERKDYAVVEWGGIILD